MPDAAPAAPWRNLRAILKATDISAANLIFGTDGLTISHVAALARRDEGAQWACILCRFLDLFQRDHCTLSLEDNR